MLTPSEMGVWPNDHLGDGDDYFRLETLVSYGRGAKVVGPPLNSGRIEIVLGGGGDGSEWS